MHQNHVEKHDDKEVNSRTELNSSAKDEMSNMEAQENMKNELDKTKAILLLSECKKRIHELEEELDKRKASEANLYEALVIQTKQLDLNKLLVEESKLEIASLKEKVVKSKAEEAEGFNKLNPMKAKPLLQKMSFLRNEIELAFEGEERDNTAKNLLEELKYLKNELKLAMKAEENSKTAMDDLVLALKEVSSECHQTKEKLVVCQVELQYSKDEAENLKALLNRTEETYKKLLGEATKESERKHNMVERLRLEAEESLLAWNEKTKEFVNCIRRSEDERTSAQEECRRLQEMVKEREDKILVSKEENQKLRDILKQALNEANVAKEAAGIAQEENSQLKDVLGVRDETVKMLTQENEMLKIHEAAPFENMRELKRLLADEAPINDLKNKGKEHKEVKGSIFDELDGDTVISDHYEMDESLDDENNSRKRKALLRRFGDLIRRKGGHTHKKGHSISNDERLNSVIPPTHNSQSSF